MRKVFLLMIALLLLAPMSVSADEIRLSPDGLTVLVPVRMFRAREADLLRLDLLERQNAEKSAQIEAMIAQIEKLMVLQEQERRSAEALQVSLRGDVAKAKSTYGILGLLAGGIAVGLAK